MKLDPLFLHWSTPNKLCLLVILCGMLQLRYELEENMKETPEGSIFH